VGAFRPNDRDFRWLMMFAYIVLGDPEGVLA
jgi:hypothetical protein